MSKRKIMALAVLLVVTTICAAVFIQSKKDSEAWFFKKEEVILIISLSYPLNQCNFLLKCIEVLRQLVGFLPLLL